MDGAEEDAQQSYADSDSYAGSESYRESDPYAGLAEATVVGRAQDGNLDAFEQLVRRYQGPLFRLGFRMLGDRGQAEDALQDVLVQVWRKLPSLSEAIAFRSWIYQIMTRRCLSMLRARAQRSAVPVDLDKVMDLESADRVSTAQVVPDPAATAQTNAQLRGLNEALALLPDDQRACWVLRELHELSYPEIAAAMNLPVSTVRGRIARARVSLAKGMEAWR